MCSSDLFTDYLRASLTTLRGDHSAVAQELALAQSYLELLQARMEDQLRFSITADDAARAQPLPPLLLQPLVENAVVHGLKPSFEGGSVRVSAREARTWCWTCKTTAVARMPPPAAVAVAVAVALAAAGPVPAWRWTTSASACWHATAPLPR